MKNMSKRVQYASNSIHQQLTSTIALTKESKQQCLQTKPPSHHTMHRIINPLTPLLPSYHRHAKQALTRIHTNHLLKHARLQRPREINEDALNGSPRLFAEANEVAA
jgi:hypothetical protein